ncbi:MAG: thioesterase [Defluviitaleaceae bacterium]|nr:thioesterase [Defluviitaleaceae bacterium]
MNLIYEQNTRITYYDLDLMGRVKLSALLRMVHIAADVNANDLGCGFKVMSAANMSFILQRFALGITRMPVYDEIVKIRTWPDSIDRGVFVRKGDMYDQEGKKLMEWASLWIVLDIAARKILKPNALPVQLPTVPDQGVTIKPEKIALPKDDTENGNLFAKYTHTVKYAEVDTNKHMNNSIYGDLIGNALFPTMEAATASQNWKEVQINFLAETRLGENIEVTARNINNELIITGLAGNEPARTSFTARVL